MDEPTESAFVVLRDGVPVLRESGTAVAEVTRLWESGLNMGDIAAHLPEVTVAAVFAALRYARNH